MEKSKMYPVSKTLDVEVDYFVTKIDNARFDAMEENNMEIRINDKVKILKLGTEYFGSEGTVIGIVAKDNVLGQIEEKYLVKTETGVKVEYSRDELTAAEKEPIQLFFEEPEKREDSIDHPAHYCTEIETIDFIRDKLPPKAFEGMCVGNVIKYISRYDKKDAPLEDLKKAQVYLGWAIESLEASK